MHRKKYLVAKNALRLIAKREGKTVEEIRKNIKAAMLVGMISADPKVQAYWTKIPCEGDIPTPEEVIVYLAGEIEEVKERSQK